MNDTPISQLIFYQIQGHPITGHEGTEGEKMYSSTLSLTSALDGVGGHRHAPAAFFLERPGTRSIGGWVGPRARLDGCENSCPTGIRSPDRPTRSESLSFYHR
jgi:hypothetical protein